MAYKLKAIYNSASSANIYCTVRSLATGYVYNGSTFVEWEDADIDDYDIPLTFQGGDLYLGDFPDLDVGSYLITYSLRAGIAPAIDDTHIKPAETIYWNGVEAESEAPTATGYYADINDLYAHYGVKNINAYSNLDNDTDTADLTIVQAALDAADTYIDRALGLQGYRTPISQSSRDFASLTEIATAIAAHRLYEARVPYMNFSTDNPEQVGSKLMYYAKREAEKRLTTFAAGRMDATRNSTKPIYPVGI